MQLFDRLITRALLPIAWTLSRGRASRMLSTFADTEADSAWQYMMAIDAAGDTATRTMLFERMLEEQLHAAAFTAGAHQLATGTDHPRQLERIALVDRPGGMPYFMAMVYLAERDVARRFETYAGAVTNADVSNVFRQIMHDEACHFDAAWHSLANLAGSPSDARRMVWRARAAVAYDAWKRSGRHIGNVIGSVIVGLVYIVVGPILALVRLVSPRS